MRKRSVLFQMISVAMAVGALLLASCSTQPPSPATSGTSATSTKPYGSLVIGVDAFGPGGTDPHVGSHSTTFQALGAAIFDSLIEMTPDGQLRPGVAERWEIAKDGMTHTFYIRKGIKFHDGTDLTGDDVKFSIERFIGPSGTHSDAAAWRAAIARVELKDDYTVAIQVKTPQFELLKSFNDFTGGPTVVPKKYIEEKGNDYFAAHPIGSGPWKLLSYERGTRAELEAVESHWRSVPKFKNLTLLSVPEEASKVAMLKTGDLDSAPVAADSAAGLKSAGLRTLTFKSGVQYVLYLFYDLQHPAQYTLGDVRVRKAMSLAINRTEMANQILSGYAEPLALYMAPKTAYFFDPNVLKPDPFDPEQAKKLLVEAGYANGFNMKLWNPGQGNEAILNSAVAGYLRKIGVNADLTQRDTATLTAMYNPKHVPEVWDTAIGKLIPSGSFGFEKMWSFYHSKGSIKNHNDPKLDELIDKVPQTLDPVEKKRLALEAAVMAKSQYGDMSVLSVDTILALGPKVGGMTPYAGMVGIAYALDTITHPK